MSHHIHHTKGIILGSEERGEANKYITIFTRELGLVRAMAQGVRWSKSKLRFTLQDFSYINVDLVRGRDVWRVTSAAHIESYANVLQVNGAEQIFKNLLRLLDRLLTGEEANIELFDHVLEAFQFLNSNPSREQLQSAEILVVLRVLFYSGYLALTDKDNFLIKNPLDTPVLALASERRRDLLALINDSLRESML